MTRDGRIQPSQRLQSDALGTLSLHNRTHRLAVRTANRADAGERERENPLSERLGQHQRLGLGEGLDVGLAQLTPEAGALVTTEGRASHRQVLVHPNRPDRSNGVRQTIAW